MTKSVVIQAILTFICGDMASSKSKGAFTYDVSSRGGRGFDKGGGGLSLADVSKNT